MCELLRKKNGNLKMRQTGFKESENCVGNNN